MNLPYQSNALAAPADQVLVAHQLDGLLQIHNSKAGYEGHSPSIALHDHGMLLHKLSEHRRLEQLARHSRHYDGHLEGDKRGHHHQDDSALPSANSAEIVHNLHHHLAGLSVEHSAQDALSPSVATTIPPSHHHHHRHQPSFYDHHHKDTSPLSHDTEHMEEHAKDSPNGEEEHVETKSHTDGVQHDGERQPDEEHHYSDQYETAPFHDAHGWHHLEGGYHGWTHPADRYSDGHHHEEHRYDDLDDEQPHGYQHYGGHLLGHQFGNHYHHDDRHHVKEPSFDHPHHEHQSSHGEYLDRQYDDDYYGHDEHKHGHYHSDDDLLDEHYYDPYHLSASDLDWSRYNVEVQGPPLGNKGALAGHDNLGKQQFEDYPTKRYLAMHWDSWKGH